MVDGLVDTVESEAMVRLRALVLSEALAECGAPPSGDAEPLDWSGEGPSMVDWAGGQRLTGLLTRAVGAGRVVLSEADRERLDYLHMTALVWSMRLEDRLCSISDRLQAAGVGDLRVIKGSAIAHLDEPDPAMRNFGDVDLLVRGEDLDRCVEVLVDMGATRPYPERRRGFDRRFAKSVTVAFDDGIEIDVHRTICDGVHAVRVPVDRLFEAPEPFVLAGREFQGMDLTARVLHAAYHAVLGSPTPRLMNLRDLVGYLTRTDVGVEAVTGEVDRWGGSAVLAEAVDLVMELPGARRADALAKWRQWRSSVVPSEDERAVIAAQRRDGSSYGMSRLRVVREIDGWSDRWGYAFGVLVPSAEHLRARGLSRWSMVTRSGRVSGRA
ncbi:MAG: nucleotidyltransferase family protein [Acidimicrobiales bacterium]|nr:nucleotidyltransferase family protein [Acidimicrobiales bacterium]